MTQQNSQPSQAAIDQALLLAHYYVTDGMGEPSYLNPMDHQLSVDKKILPIYQYRKLREEWEEERQSGINAFEVFVNKNLVVIKVIEVTGTKELVSDSFEVDEYGMPSYEDIVEKLINKHQLVNSIGRVTLLQKCVQATWQKCNPNHPVDYAFVSKYDPFFRSIKGDFKEIEVPFKIDGQALCRIPIGLEDEEEIENIVLEQIIEVLKPKSIHYQPDTLGEIEVDYRHLMKELSND